MWGRRDGNWGNKGTLLFLLPIDTRFERTTVEMFRLFPKSESRKDFFSLLRVVMRFPFFFFSFNSLPSNLQYKYLDTYKSLPSLCVCGCVILLHNFFFFFEYWNRRDQDGKLLLTVPPGFDAACPSSYIRSPWNKRRRKWQQMDEHKENETHPQSVSSLERILQGKR